MIIAEDDFEDGDFNNIDPLLTNGLSWKVVEGNAGIVSNQLDGYSLGATRDNGALENSTIITQQEIETKNFTIVFDAYAYYNQPTKMIFLYKDRENYYFFGITGNEYGIYRVFNGIKKRIDNEKYGVATLPYSGGISARYKIHIENNGSVITIMVDKDGYSNGADYELVASDASPLAPELNSASFGIQDYSDSEGGNIWFSIDNVAVYKGLILDEKPWEYRDFYVDCLKGNDTNDGSYANPMKTIQKAIDLSLPGDTVIVKPGICDERVRFSKWKIYGLPGHKLTIKAQPRRSVLMMGFDTEYADYLRIGGFNITHDLPEWYNRRGGIWARSDYIEVADNYLYNLGFTAISSSGRGNVIENNTIYACQKGIGVGGSDWVVENNEVKRLVDRGGGDCDYSRFFGYNGTLRKNIFHGTNFSETGHAHVDCFQTFDDNCKTYPSEYAHDILIDSNYCADFHQGLMGEAHYCRKSGNITFSNNIFIRGGHGIMEGDIDNITVINNLFYSLRGQSVILTNSTGHIVKNNIFYNTSMYRDSFGYSSISSDSNAHYPFRRDVRPGDLTGIDPLFRNPAKEDFHLLQESPLLDEGADVGIAHDYDGISRPIGTGIDIGPFEFQGNGPTASFSYSHRYGYAPLRILFNATRSYSTDASITGYLWDFGDGSTSTQPVVYHEYNHGVYNATLVVTDSIGRYARTQRTVTVWHERDDTINLYLPFDNTTKDLSGKNVFLTQDNDACYTKGKLGEALCCNGSLSVYVSQDNIVPMDNIPEITIALWARKNKPEEDEYIVHKHTVYSIYLGKREATARLSTVIGGSELVAGNINDTEWHHYALSYNGSVVNFYLDGELAQSKSLNGTVKNGPWWGVQLCKDPWGDTFDGSIDEVFIYSRSLSESDIRKLMNISVISPRICTHAADTNCDNKINIMELFSYIQKWLNNQVDMHKLIEAVRLWKNG